MQFKKVITSLAKFVKSYTNFTGTYHNLIAYPVAPGTHFLCADVQRSQDRGDFNYYTDPFFEEGTPRILTLEEIDIISQSSRWNEYKYIMYDPNTNKIIDFYSPLNTIIGKFWDHPTVEWRSN